MPIVPQFSWRISPQAAREHRQRLAALHLQPQVPHRLWQEPLHNSPEPQRLTQASSEGTQSSASASTVANTKVSCESEHLAANKIDSPQATETGSTPNSHLSISDSELSRELEARLTPLMQEWRARGPGALAWSHKVVRALLDQHRLATNASLPNNFQPLPNPTQQERQIAIEPLVPLRGGLHLWNPTRQVWQIEVLLHDVVPGLPEWLRLLQIALADLHAPALLSVSHSSHSQTQAQPLAQAQPRAAAEFQAAPHEQLWFSPQPLALLDVLTLASACWVESTQLAPSTLERYLPWTGRLLPATLPEDASPTQVQALAANQPDWLNAWNHFPWSQLADPETLAQPGLVAQILRESGRE